MIAKFINCRSAAVYAAGHFLVDFSCAFVMFSRQPDPIWFLVYNFLAFAMQFPIGILADRYANNRMFAIVGIALVLAGVMPFPVILSMLLVGLGNAAYHIGGGRDALLRSRRLTPLGIFVSPGAVGIYLGSLMSREQRLQLILPVLLLVCMTLIHIFCSGEKVFSRIRKPIPVTLGLMSIIVLIRSFAGMSMTTPWKSGVYLFAAAVGAAFGKTLGGVLADRFGIRKCGCFSLMISALLFCFPGSGLAGVFGVLFFNMTMPITLRRAADALPGAEGAAFGLLTLGLFIGFLPKAFGITISPYLGAVLSVLSAIALMLDREKRNV